MTDRAAHLLEREREEQADNFLRPEYRGVPHDYAATETETSCVPANSPSSTGYPSSSSISITSRMLA
jgi:hypothetical protein